MQQVSRETYRPALNWKRPAVLLIDGDEKRQFGRAARMRGCGVVVDCAADGASAYALWRAEAYRLVLIDFSGAGEAVREFCTHVQASSPLQKIGFYRTLSPFLSRSEMAAPAVEASPLPPVVEPIEAPKTASRVTPPGRFLEAAQQIAALRLRAGRRQPARYSAVPRQDRPKVESAASLAARILGGN
jgi:CheY-like chemotaxis protein